MRINKNSCYIVAVVNLIVCLVVQSAETATVSVVFGWLPVAFKNDDEEID